jgi:predicted pyridoxine 5'-phosphate oxidase superfamily flavin-nucleotide-binding protein
MASTDEALMTFYGDGARMLQDRFDTRRIADRIEERLVKATIDAGDKVFIEGRDMFFLATVDKDGRANCSYKGGEPGFVRVIDEQTLAFPSADGNGMFLSLGGVLETGQVGLLFIDFDAQTRVRVNGTATIDANEPLLATWPEAQAVVRVAVREVFPNCPRYIHRLALVARSRFVPKLGCDTPVPAWKRADWAADAVADSDPSKDPAREVLKR